MRDQPLSPAFAPLWDELVERRYPAVGADPSSVLADLERLQKWVDETKNGPNVSTFYVRAEFLPYTWAQICALGRMGESIAPLVRERIAARDFHFVLAAGAGRVASCFDACEKLFRAQQPSASHWERMYPAWAMMRIDAERGARVLTSSWSSFDRDDRSIAARLLGLSDARVSLDWLRAQQALPDGARDEALKDGQSVHDLGLTLDDALFF